MPFKRDDKGHCRLSFLSSLRGEDVRMKDIIVIAIFTAINFLLFNGVPWQEVAVIDCLIIVAYRRFQG